jgi:hypothetical protein
MNENEIKTRQGLILEEVCGAALAKAGYSFAQGVQYDGTCEEPDFLVPDEEAPRFVFEVHQTEARNSFQMKTLRAFTAVTEAKAHFGNQLISVNVLFGDPDNELPASNVKAMCGIFDVNIIPQRECAHPGLIRKMEAFALTLASDEGKKTEVGGKEVAKKHLAAVTELAALLKNKMRRAKARHELDHLWNLERARTKTLGTPPTAGDPTYYKRCMLWALFLNDEDFAELHRKIEPDRCSASVRKQLLATKLATVSEEIDGDHLSLKPEFTAFLRDPDCLRLRAICKQVLDTVPAMKCFFEDIRDGARRRSMANHFYTILKQRRSLQEEVMANISSDSYGGVSHSSRCWIADIAARYLGVSHNRMNAALRDGGWDSQRLGNPFNQLSYKSARFLSDETTHPKYAKGVEHEFNSILKSSAGTVSTSVENLAQRLLELRLDGFVKLRKLDPLFLVANGICSSLGLRLVKSSVITVASDLAGKVAVGRFEVFGITPEVTSKTVLLNSVAVHDGHGDDKSKEWGARRMATLYRLEKGKIRKSEYQEGIFVLDGEWKDKDVARLHRSGWNHVVRLADLEKTLRSVFGIKTAKKTPPANLTPIGVPEDDEDLAMAAEEDAPQKLTKRRKSNGR